MFEYEVIIEFTFSGELDEKFRESQHTLKILEKRRFSTSSEIGAESISQNLAKEILSRYETEIHEAAIKNNVFRSRGLLQMDTI